MTGKVFGDQDVTHMLAVDEDDGEGVLAMAVLLLAIVFDRQVTGGEDRYESMACLALVGPSGCGKSTLLRMIAGLESITGGTLEINGRRVNGLPSKNRDIAMVFQNYALYPHMTVSENMDLSLKLRGSPKPEIGTRVREAAAILALEDFLERCPRQFSGGQRQRVAMGRAIVRDPSVSLFDEPLSNLNAKLRISMRTEINELHQRLGITAVYVTRDQVEAMTMADRIAVMRDGIVEQVDRPLELYDEPVNQFVAGFIGSPAMNLLTGRLEQSDGRLIFRTDKGTTLPYPADANNNLVGRSLVLGIRPENISLASDGAEETVDTCVGVVEPMGAETIVAMHLDGDALFGSFRERINIGANGDLQLRIDCHELHLFDAASDERLPSTHR